MSVKGEPTVVEPTRAEQQSARRAAESKATIPHVTVSADIDMARAIDRPDSRALVPKACALALREHPRVNGAYRDGRFELHGRVNVGIAIAAGDAVVVPAIVDADRKSLAEITGEIQTLAERAANGTITPPELSGATFTISETGVDGIAGFVAVIHPQQAATLGLGSVAPRAVVRDGAVTVRPVLTATLSADHRIVSARLAAEFLARVRALLEAPEALGA